MPFQPGNQEAVKGSKTRLFRQQLIAALNDVPDGEVSRIRLIAEQLAKLAESGDIQAIKEVADRIDGKPAQAVTGEGGGAVIISWQSE